MICVFIIDYPIGCKFFKKGPCLNSFLLFLKAYAISALMKIYSFELAAGRKVDILPEVCVLNAMHFNISILKLQTLVSIFILFFNKLFIYPCVLM